ncbi:uncharacterized protein [Diadema antillarum]|uniref:uncharacterized protein n=1 Tax=Diadema antillarum TaxID=105358 RepID=UPI003A8663CC
MTNANAKIDSAANNVNSTDKSVKEAWPTEDTTHSEECQAMEKIPLTSEEKVKEPLRVILWTAPRSLSTAFERCMTMVPNSKIFNEMYAAAYLLGPNRQKQWWPKLTPKHSFKYCKTRLERDLSEYDFVFAKDFALGMHEHTDMLPKGYQHTFLIRHPQKMFTSLRKTLCASKLIKYLSLGGKIQRCFPGKGYFYQDMWELYQYLTKQEDQPVPIILDADDIIRDPETMIRKYCESIGLTFQPEILKWNKAELSELPWEGAKIFRAANWLIGYYNNALRSTGFVPPDIDYTVSMHPDVLYAVEYSMPFYKELYSRRIVLDKVARIPTC